MPACYTHKKVGALALRQLPVPTRKLIRKYLPYYLIGLHGPDILFYQPAGKHAEAAEFGRKLHHVPFSEFFDNAREVIRNSEDDRQLVYLYGYLCHLFSDNRIHAVLPGMYEKAGVTHEKMEAELDRFLMNGDGYDPLTYPVAAHIACNREVAHVIAPFYLGVSETQVLLCLAAMKAGFGLSRSASKTYRQVAAEVMEFAGQSKKVASMIMSGQESEACAPFMPQLRLLTDESAAEAAKAIEEVGKYIYFDEIVPNYIAFRMDGQNDA